MRLLGGGGVIRDLDKSDELRIKTLKVYDHSEKTIQHFKAINEKKLEESTAPAASSEIGKIVNNLDACNKALDKLNSAAKTIIKASTFEKTPAADKETPAADQEKAAEDVQVSTNIRGYRPEG